MVSVAIEFSWLIWIDKMSGELTPYELSNVIERLGMLEAPMTFVLAAHEGH
jgi:hypothetical protein